MYTLVHVSTPNTVWQLSKTQCNKFLKTTPCVTFAVYFVAFATFSSFPSHVHSIYAQVTAQKGTAAYPIIIKACIPWNMPL